VDLSDQEGRTIEGSGEETELGRLFEWLHQLSMGEDLAERVDDLICAWDKVVGTDIETVVLLLLGWLGFGGFIFTVSHMVYSTMGPNDTAQIQSPASIPPYQGGETTTKNTSQKLLVSTHQQIPPPALQNNVVGSDQDAVEFANACKEFIEKEELIRKDLVISWMEKLNEFTMKSAVEDGFLVEFLQIIDEATSEPNFVNLTVETMPSDNILITGEINTSISFRLRTSRPVRDEMVASESILNLDRIRGRFSITFITAEDLLIAKLEGWPDIKSRFSFSASPSHTLTREEMNLAEVVEEVALQAVRGVQMDINPSMINNFPKFVRKYTKEQKHGQRKHTNPAFSMRKNAQSSNDKQEMGRKLDVKIVKASQLGGQAGVCSEPYVVMEVDDPSQKMQSRTGSGTEFTWNDTFTIEITKHSSEVLFEVWDQGQKIGKSDAFMGLAIVSVSELMVTASQRHVVPLQGRPYEEDQVTGLLTVEFLFKDSVMASKDEGLHKSEGAYLASEQLKLAGQSKSSQPTMIPDLLAVTSIDKDDKLIEAKKEIVFLRPPRTRPTRPKSSDAQLNGTSQESMKKDALSLNTGEVVKKVEENSNHQDTDSLSRGRKRTRMFFNSIKRKISGTRSLSSTSTQQDPSEVRSVSENRNFLRRTASSLSSRTHDDASSLSGISGISNASARTFVTEESSLVLETVEQGRRHHYLIPIQVAKRGRFKKKGTKLHVYMDHIFVAQHLKLGSTCDACLVSIPLRLGKQGYICRDCGMVTHKPCHIKVSTHCQQTSLPSMDLEYYSEDLKM